MRLLLTIFLAFSIPENDCSTFYLIRHAEKVRTNKSDRDPALNEKGIIRALNWKEYFINKDISKIYSTNYKRTLETVKPIQEAIGLTAILYSLTIFFFRLIVMFAESASLLTTKLIRAPYGGLGPTHSS